MERTTVTGSSSIRGIGYDPATQELEIEYGSGVYVYYDVPAHVHRDLLDAESKGKFSATYLKGRYQCERR